MKVLIVDYGMGNLASVRRALEECGADVFISDDPQSLKEAGAIILPGVGAFSDGMNHLRDRAWIAPLRQSVIEDRIPFLGICLGMQFLADRSFEGQETQGLGWISGDVVRLERKTSEERIPHMGWNEVFKRKSHSILADVADGTDFYFVHSFHFAAKDPAAVVAVTPYCGGFVSVVAKENIVGVQFHPEKSSKAGFQVLRNFLSSC